MNKRELMTKIKEIMPGLELEIEYNGKRNTLRKEIEKCDERIKGNEKDTLLRTFFRVLFGLPIVLSIIAVPVISVLDLIFKFENDVIILLQAVKVVVGITLVLTPILTAWDRHVTKKVLVDLRKNRVELEEQYQAVCAEREKVIAYWRPRIHAVIPREYASRPIVNRIYSYLANNRADNLKEAINLYELEEHRNRVERKQADISNELFAMQRAQNALERRVEAAESDAQDAWNYAHYRNNF